jgi:hypothetical protein
MLYQKKKVAKCWKHQASVSFQAFTAGAAQMTVICVIQWFGIICFFWHFSGQPEQPSPLPYH